MAISANWISISIGSTGTSQSPPFGSEEIVTELKEQMVSEVNSEDLITETS